MRVLVMVAWLVAGCQFDKPGSGTIDAPADPEPDGLSGVDAPDGTPDASPVDATPDARPDARPCPAAPADCVAFTCGTASCYYVCAPNGWGSAESQCQGRGLGCLATIGDATENTCIATLTNPVFPDLVWFGFAQSPSGSEPGGGWGWACGSSTFVAGNWGSSEPNNSGGNEDCGAMGAGGGWIDGDCSIPMRYVCEIVP